MYLMFNREIIVENACNISLEIDREIKLSIGVKKYKIFSAILHDLVSYLPPDTKIKYKGFFGSQFKKDLEKNNNPLMPGKFYKSPSRNKS